MCHKDAAQMLPMLAKTVEIVVSFPNSLISCARCQCCCGLRAVICAYLNSELITSHSASQVAFPPFTIVFMLLTRTEVFWEQLELLLAEKNRVSLNCISPTTGIHIYLSTCTPFFLGLKVDKEWARSYPYITRVFNHPKSSPLFCMNQCPLLPWQLPDTNGNGFVKANAQCPLLLLSKLHFKGQFIS